MKSSRSTAISLSTEIPGPRSRELIDRWHRYEADVTGIQAEVVWDSAEGCLVTDVDGNVYIDWTSGVLVTNVGHCHPHLVAEARKSTGRLLNNYECANVERIEASRRLVSALPPHLDKVFFLSTGSEAVEGAIRLMKRHSGGYEVISFHAGFHGRTTGSASAGGLAGPKKGYGPTVPGVIRAPYPNPYRDPLGWCGGGPEFRTYFDFLDELVAVNSTGSLAGVLVEPYQGAGGFIFPPEGWLKELERWVRRRNLVYILDEVQASYGRTGTMWALEHENLEPDLLALGKATGCGVPVSAIAARSDFFSGLAKGEMSSTLGGNPVSSAAVCAVLDIFEKEPLVLNSRNLGAWMKGELEKIAENSRVLGDVRGRGLVMGLEFVLDKATKEPAPEFTKNMIRLCAEEGLLTGAVGMYGNVLRVAPPLVMTKELAMESLSAFKTALQRAEANL
ncbi:MAG: aspartate aminotransferase family protein [Balneolaceae bacterium]